MTPSPTRDIHTPVAVTILLIGAVLLAFMVTTEGEPGALPLALLVVGTAWLVWARRRRRGNGDGR